MTDHQQHQQHLRLLEAGAILPAGTVAGTGADSAVDVLTARSYTHPALDGRRVVRLVPGALGPAEDLALDFLGLAPAVDPTDPAAPAGPAEVGQVRQEALGFPAWALVHDPANGHHALALVKEIERLARQARSKPGHAKDGFGELALQLDRTVPHFLPTFWEQAGRIFLELGNQTYAGMFFGRAREAERVHGLAVDEERLRAVFLEFALGGALTVKELRQYVKSLTARLDAGTAWARFRQLCAERSAAGMAPYAGVAEDARALIKAAGLDRAEAEQALLAELIASPAVNRAPAAFWQSWHGALVALARREETVRARLLEILPNPSAERNTGAADEAWLKLLAETGADELLTDHQKAHSETAARWLRRWVAHLGRGWGTPAHSGQTIELAARLAERLRAEGEPVDLFGDSRKRGATQLNLLDLLLAERVPVADPPGDFSLDLRAWLNQGGAERRDLAAVAADARFRPFLKSATAGVWQADWVRKGEDGTGLATLSALFTEWADDRAEELLGARGLAGAQALLTSLGPLRPAIMAANPRAAERIASLDVSGLLARTLRAGIIDELGWPALEEGLRLLGLADTAHPGVIPGQHRKGGPVMISEAWPALILYRQGTVVVVGPQEVLLQHEVRIPDPYDKAVGPRLRFVDGELLVIWYHDGKQRAYWSHRPAEVFTLGGEQVVHRYYFSTLRDPASVPLPDGGRATGGRALHAGDTVLPPALPVLADGTGFWTVQAGHRQAITEYDPATGTRGRASTPPQFAAATDGGGHLLAGSCHLLPLQPGLEQSPLGTDGAVLGHWVRAKDGQVTTGGVDGRTVTVAAAHGGGLRHPLGRLTLPEGAEPLLIAEGDRLALCSAEGDGRPADHLAAVAPGRHGDLHAAGTALVPPAEYWHALRPRDGHGSRLLRAVGEQQAAELLDAAWPVDEGEEAGKDRGWLVVQGVRRKVAGHKAAATVPLDAVRRALPELAHPLLLAGVAGLARVATDTAARAARYASQPKEKGADRTAPAAPKPAPYRPEHGRDHELREALELVEAQPRGFGPSWGANETWHVLKNLRAVTDRLAEPSTASEPTTATASKPTTATASGDAWQVDPEPVRLHEPSSYYGWIHLLGRLGPLALAAASPAVAPESRATLALLLAELTRGSLADRGAQLREVTLSEQLGAAAATGDRKAQLKRVGQVLRRGDRTVVVIACVEKKGRQVHWLALDHDPSGVFGPVADLAVVAERPAADSRSAAWYAQFAAQLAEHGAFEWRPEAVEEFAAATGIGRTRAALLLAGAPRVTGWHRSFLSAEQLALLGLKAAEADEAREWGRRRSVAELDELRGALLPAEPARLWSEGLALGPAAELWLARQGGRLVTLPDPARAASDHVLVEVIEELLNPASTGWLSRTTRQRVRRLPEYGNDYPRLVGDDPGAVIGRQKLYVVVRALHWLAYHLPYGDPLRPLLPQAHQAILDRLADPGLLLDLGLAETAQGGLTAPVLRTRFGLPEQGGHGEDGLTPCGPALMLGKTAPEIPFLRPAGLTGPEDPLLDLLGGLVAGHGFQPDGPALRTLLGEELRRLLSDGVGADEPAGWPQDPQRSAPALVTEVAKETGLGEDAAALYLQLLALPDPTDRNTARWTGWKPARLKQARAELAATDLVVEAKRARAGRSLFLPGGWQEAKAPALPVETWKAGLYELADRSVILPQLPAAELFTLAWQRVQDGDAPGYEELRITNRRKARR